MHAYTHAQMCRFTHVDIKCKHHDTEASYQQLCRNPQACSNRNSNTRSCNNNDVQLIRKLSSKQECSFLDPRIPGYCLPQEALSLFEQWNPRTALNVFCSGRTMVSWSISMGKQTNCFPLHLLGQMPPYFISGPHLCLMWKIHCSMSFTADEDSSESLSLSEDPFRLYPLTNTPIIPSSSHLPFWSRWNKLTNPPYKWGNTMWIHS